MVVTVVAWVVVEQKREGERKCVCVCVEGGGEGSK